MRVIITGVTGMVGEAVMLRALERPEVNAVLTVSRKAHGRKHPKLTELIHDNFYDISAIADKLRGFDACFFCLGVTSLGKGEEEYTKLTYELTMNFAKALVQINPDLVFEYISGAGTDSTEKGKLMWARVKGRTENELLTLGFKDAYAVRPGILKPIKGATQTHKFYYLLGWLYPLIRLASKTMASSLEELADCMIFLVLHPQTKKHIEVRDIIELATKMPPIRPS